MCDWLATFHESALFKCEDSVEDVFKTLSNLRKKLKEAGFENDRRDRSRSRRGALSGCYADTDPFLYPDQQEYPVRARIRRISGFSAHADQNELLKWLRTSPARPRKVFVTHGEPEAADALAELIGKELGWNAEVPEYKQTANLF